MTRRKGELSDATLDREFPFKVGLPADKVAGFLALDEEQHRSAFQIIGV